MLDQLEQIEKRALSELEAVQNEDALQSWKVTHLGRNSPLMKLFDQLGNYPKEERPIIGRQANQVKQTIEAELNSRETILRQEALLDALTTRGLDITLPGRTQRRGRFHPVTKTLRKIVNIFTDMGFQVYRSREVETDEYNFQLLNFPPNHPAREMQDSYYIVTEKDRGENPILLRTHTSPGQIHAMRQFAARNPEKPPPIRIVLPGMCYRYEQVSARYEVQFTQVEGLVVGETITFGDLKGTINDFAHRMFGENVHTRFRAAHFPFTEPSAEVDFECYLCGGEGCTVCKYTGWLEIMGCGMVHPVVLQNGGYNPSEYTGYAFGMGPERLAMLLYQIEDIRYFWQNDLRFLEQF